MQIRAVFYWPLEDWRCTQTSLAFGRLPEALVATSLTPIPLPLWQHQGYAASQNPWPFENTPALIHRCNKFELAFLGRFVLPI